LGTCTNIRVSNSLYSQKLYGHYFGGIFYPAVVITDGSGYSGGGGLYGLTSYFVSELINSGSSEATINLYVSSTSLPVYFHFNVATPIYPVWYQKDFVYSYAGNYSEIVSYPGIVASTSIQEYTFSGSLYSGVVDFNGNGTSTLWDSFSTSTFPGFGHSLNPQDIENGVAANCTPFSSFWSLGLCINYLLYPDPAQVDLNIQTLRNDFLVRVPIGYLTRFIELVSSSSTVPLVVLDATLPSVLPGGGSSVRLDLSHALDPIFGATVGIYGTSTQTFYEVTSYYWNIIVGLLFLFYVVRRVVGSHLIPKTFHL
jgi:hypothetical protein